MWNIPACQVSQWSFFYLVRTPLLLLTPGQVGISQVEQKYKYQQKTEGGMKKRQNTDLGQQNIRSRGLWHFWHSVHVCYVWLSLELSENLTQQPKMLTHMIFIFHFSLTLHLRLNCSMSLTWLLGFSLVSHHKRDC